MTPRLLIPCLLLVACGQHINASNAGTATRPDAATHRSDTETGRGSGAGSSDTAMIAGQTKPASDTIRRSLTGLEPTYSFLTDLNGDSTADTIRLSTRPNDTTLFTAISISLTGYGKQIIYADSPWNELDEWWLNSPTNAIPTNKFFLAKSPRHSVILMFGALSAAGYREDFSIVNIENNEARKVLNQNQRHLYIETPISLTDLNGDGRLDFVYRQIFEYAYQVDSLNGNVGTYSPYFVYSVDDKCELNKPLTIRYNTDNYVFAGFSYSERIDVFYPNDPLLKPTLWKGPRKSFQLQ